MHGTAPQGGVREGPDRAEPGVAAGLLSNSRQPAVVSGAWRGAGTTGRVRTRVPPVPDGEQVRRLDAVERALADHEALFGRPPREQCPVDPETGELLPVLTVVTDNGGPFRSFRFETFIELHPELAHVRTRVRTPGQNGSRERGFGTLKYERLYLDEIDDAVMLAERAEDYRIEYNEIRPHQAIAFNRPKEAHGPGRPHHPDIRDQ